MSSFENRQPGGLWHTPSNKALSFSWATSSGFPGAMQHTAEAGSIRRANLAQTCPMVMATPKPQNAPYMSYNGGASWGHTFKDILATMLQHGKTAEDLGLTSAVGKLLHHVSGVPKAPMPMERGEVAPGIRGPDLGQAPKRSRFGGAMF